MKYQLENCFVNIRNNTEYLDVIQKSLSGNSKVTFFYLNSFSFYLTNKNEEFREAFHKAAYIIADGYSIVWMLRKLNKVKIDKVVFTYSFFAELSKLLNKENSRIYLLGGTLKVIKQSSKILQSKYRLNIVGYSTGYFDYAGDFSNRIEHINKSKPNILIVGMGMPLSENWIQNNLDKINAKIIFSVGGFFDFLVKEKIMAPRWMYNSGFEWVYRLIQEPGRLFKRYLVANSFLIYYLIRTKFKNAFRKN